MQQQITYRSLAGLHLWQFKKRKSNWLLMLVFLLAGYYGLFRGFAVKHQQIATVAAFKQERDSALNKVKAGLNADTLTKAGKEAYNEASNVSVINWGITLPVYKYPVSTAIFNTGQSDVFTYYYSLRLESFIMQLFKQTEIGNPLRSLTGHFDVTFWLVYLLPLLALLLCFNTLAAERDNGNWRLIYSQGVNAKKWVAAKFIMAACILGSLLFTVALTGFIINIIYFKQAPGLRDILFFTGALVYLLFWMSVLYFINATGKETGQNALVSGLAWIGMCILLPGAVSKIAENVIPVDNTPISTFSRRPQNTKIDESNVFAASLITAFIKKEPAYKLADTISSKPAFQSRVYRAWHTTLDRERWPAVQKYYTLIEKRQLISNYSTLLNPAGSLDGLLTGVAANDAAAHHYFVYQALQFHQHMQAALYPSLFFDARLKKSDYDKLPVFNYKPLAVSYNGTSYLVLLFLSLFIFIISNKKLKKV